MIDRRRFLQTTGLAFGGMLFSHSPKAAESASLEGLASLAPGAPPGVDPADPLFRLGFLDVTKAPYLADPTGAADATEAIQRAVNDAREFQYVCFFPSGIYTISDTISCEMKVYKLAQPRSAEGKRQHYWGDRNRPCILMGSKKGPRPTIRLATGAPGFGDPGKPKPAIYIWAQTRNNAEGKDEPIWGKEQPNISFNQIFRGIDIDVRGHAGAIGIKHTGSQGSTLEDSTIQAEGAFAGMFNCPGQGGGTYGVKVEGGRYGLYAIPECRFPMLAACEFTGQTSAAVAYSSVGLPLLLAGCLIRDTRGPALDLSQAKPSAGACLVDCIVSMAGGGDAIATPGPWSLLLENVYLTGAERIRSGGDPIADPAKWTRIERYASCSAGATHCLDGVFSTGEIAKTSIIAGAPPFDEIRDKHGWSDKPSFEDDDAANARTLGAAGDGLSDDTAALQAALDAHRKVYLPRGVYRVAKPLRLRPDSCLFGTARIYSTILADRTFSSAEGLVSTADDARASTRISSLSLAHYISSPNVLLLDWKAGRNSIAHDVYFQLIVEGAAAPVEEHATFRVSGHGGGRIFAVNSVEGLFAPTTNHPGYRRILVDGTEEPLAIYALNVERARSNPQGEIRNAKNVAVYYLKTEAGSSGPDSRNTSMRIAHSRDIAIYCVSGVVQLEPGRPMVEIAESANVKVALARSFRDGPYATLRETIGGASVEIPSETTAALYWRGGE